MLLVTTAGKELRVPWEHRVLAQGLCHLAATRLYGRKARAILFFPCSLVQENPEVAMDCTVYLSQLIGPAERAQVLQLLSTMDNPAST